MLVALSSSMKRIISCCVALGLGFLASSAFADAAAVKLSPQQRDVAAQPGREWYGWQTLMSDVISSGLLIGGLEMAGNSDSRSAPTGYALATVGGAGYVLGAPALHFMHERPAAAAGSLGLRLVLPVLGGLIGSGLAQCPPPPPQDYGNCGLPELVMGVGVGSLAAIAVDAGVLAWAPVKEEAPAAPRLGFAPVISNDGKRGEVRVFGTF
jgi:hypothetical protein